MYMTPKLSNNLTNGVPEMSRAKLQIQAEAYNKCMERWYILSNMPRTDKITTFSRILIEIFIITFKSSRTSSRMLMFKQILIA